MWYAFQMEVQISNVKLRNSSLISCLWNWSHSKNSMLVRPTTTHALLASLFRHGFQYTKMMIKMLKNGNLQSHSPWCSANDIQGKCRPQKDYKSTFTFYFSQYRFWKQWDNKKEPYCKTVLNILNKIQFICFASALEQHNQVGIISALSSVKKT